MDNIREAFAWYFMQKERSSYVRDAAAQKDVDDLAEWIPQGVIYDEPLDSY